MSEKQPVFTVTDRRKFTLEGDLRDESADASTSTEVSESAPGPRLITNAPPESTPQATAISEQIAPEHEENAPETPPEVSAQDEAAARHAYQQSSDHIETMLRAANPAAGAAPSVTIEHVIQSIYLSAVVALGAAAEPGQKPHIDILGARQSIDMLGALQEKTKGNLSEKEQRLLQNALFEVRMMFLEVTNAIAQQAQRPPQAKK